METQEEHETTLSAGDEPVTYTEQLREEFNKKFIMNHGEYGKTLMVPNGIDDVTDWWIAKHNAFIAEKVAEIEKLEKELVSHEDESSVFVKHGYNTALDEVLALFTNNNEKKV